MNFYNPKVAHLITDIPIGDLVKRIQRLAVEQGENSAVEADVLRRFLIDYVPILRMEMPQTERLPELTRHDATEIIQELLSQHYLTMSDKGDGKRLYFEVRKAA
jgi:hypothetical protein